MGIWKPVTCSLTNAPFHVWDPEPWELSWPWEEADLWNLVCRNGDRKPKLTEKLLRALSAGD